MRSTDQNHYFMSGSNKMGSFNPDGTPATRSRKTRKSGVNLTANSDIRQYTVKSNGSTPGGDDGMCCKSEDHALRTKYSGNERSNFGK